MVTAFISGGNKLTFRHLFKEGSTTAKVSVLSGGKSVTQPITVVVKNTTPKPVMVVDSNKIADFSIFKNDDSERKFSIANMFNDEDNDNTKIVVEMENSNENLITVTKFHDDSISVKAAKMNQGSAKITFKANSFGSLASTSFTVTVKDTTSAKPIVAKPIQDIKLGIEKYTWVSLVGVFTDADNDDDKITVKVKSDDTDVADAAVKGDSLLVTSFLPTGYADITVTANSDGHEVSDKFRVTVYNENDTNGISVANEIADISVDEDGTVANVSLGNVFKANFTDSMTFSADIVEGSEDLATLKVNADSTLSITLGEHKNGDAKVRVTLRDSKLKYFASDYFMLNVKSIDDAPKSKKAFADLVLNKVTVDSVVDLSEYYEDVDTEITYTASSANNGVVETSVTGNKLTLTIKGEGKSDFYVTATSGELSFKDTINFIYDLTAPTVTFAANYSSEVGLSNKITLYIEANEALAGAPNVHEGTHEVAMTKLGSGNFYKGVYTVDTTGTIKFDAISKDQLGGYSDTSSFTVNVAKVSAKASQLLLDANTSLHIANNTFANEFNLYTEFTELDETEFDGMTLVSKTGYKIVKPNVSANKYMTLEFNVDLASIKNSKKVGLYRNEDNVWTYVGGEAQANGKLVVEVKEFGEFAVLYNENHVELPEDFQLLNNYPNPFNPVTTIPFALPERAHVTLNVYNVLGQHITKIVDGMLPAGHYNNYKWNGKNSYGVQMSSGIYFYQLVTKDKVLAKKMILIK